jgi:hypothetical protein
LRGVGSPRSFAESPYQEPLVRSALTASALLAGSLVASPGRAQSPAPAPSDPPRTEVEARRPEQKVNIGGTSIAMRASEDGFQDATLTAPAARLFEVLAAAYADVGLTLKETDMPRQQTGTGTFRAQYRIGKQRMSTFLDCGLDPMGLKQADSYAISMRVTTQIVPESADRATVRTLVQATGRPPSNSGLELHCPSTGKLEQKIAEAVAARAGREP